MVDFTALRANTGLKADCRCVCGSKVFGLMPLMVTNHDGRSLSSQIGDGNCASIYVIHCLCGRRYIMASTPKDHDCTLIPFDSVEAAAYLEPAMPDFDNMAATDEVPQKK